ncbi:GPI mannosyltransferase 3 [Rhinichthys klamathensis goyatoka]|uniref:GPI mannosyltransferase 3 n=1 Tax=Rhinichthys klamathensis goyatoka TaxID=3034132 RepID=UPI0024B58F45|nr:GPI mannosyltransferase 3 [Rhinichthys klamathensis goyatoka]
MEKIRERFKQNKSSCESVRLRKRSSILYSTDDRRPQTLEFFGISVSVFTVIFRLLNCLLVQTSFVPDEYWQSLEISHRMVFSYGYETWEWKEGIRGYSYPLLFALMYKLLDLMNYDTAYLLVFLPRVFQALLAAYADVKLYHLVLQWETPDVAKWTCFCQLCSWFTWYCCSRTLTNTMETVLTTLALCFYPLPGSKMHNSWKYLCLVSLAVVIRPTALIVWLPLLFYHFCGEQNKLKLITQQCIPIAALALAVSTLIDSVFYGKWIFVQWNFLKFNVLHNVAEFYGAHPWHWYFTQGLLVVIGPHLPFFMHGCSLATKKHRILLITILWTTAIYSLLSHKEFRFIYPVLPFCMIFCGISLAKLQAWRKTAAGALLVLNLFPALYTGLIHQRGNLDVMHDLQRLCDISDSQNSTELLFLMPCHSTPLYSHLHCPLKLRFLECPPDLTANEEYVDEAAVFFSNPLHWLRTSFPSQSTLPSHIVLFDFLEKEIAAFLEENRFTKQAEIFHTHFPEGRVGKNILIYTRGSGLKIDSFL